MWELLVPVPGPIHLWHFSCKPHGHKDEGSGLTLLSQDQGGLFLIEKHTFIAL